MLSINEVGQESSAQVRRQAIKMTGVSFAVIDQYKDLVYRTALTVTGNHSDAEDVMQEVFFKYFRSHPTFESESHEKAWILRVTVNAGKSVLRSAWHRKRVDVDITQLPGQTEEGGHSEVLNAVLSLPEKYRIAIYLHYYEDYSIREIASITGQSETAVSQQLSRGRTKLRKKLGGARI